MQTGDERRALEAELRGERDALACWWLRHVVDLERGTIAGCVDEENRVDHAAPLSLVYVARLLWFFSALARHGGDDRHRRAAALCRRRLLDDFSDPRHGGLYWRVDAAGRPLSRKKQTYGIAFAIYALAEHHRAGDDDALPAARALAASLERHALDREHGGFLEALSEDWGPLDDVRLGPGDLDADKTLNTHLHLLEAWTGLARVDPAAAPRLRELLQLYLARFVRPVDGVAPCFYRRDWRLLPSGHCPGHAIEAGWLIGEAAQVLGEAADRDAARAASLALAAGVLADAVDGEGGVVNGIEAGRVSDPARVWWVQAEAMVGFYHAWQLGGDRRYLRASRSCWAFIRAQHRDPQGGEWYWYARGDRRAPAMYKAGPWKGPYHNGRALLEMLRRLAAQR